MLKYVRNKDAQVVASEYVLIFFLVLGMLTALGLYFRRTVQGRIYSARNFMITSVRDELATELSLNEFAGNLYVEYEPYYLDTESLVSREINDQKELKSSFGLSSGIFHKEINQYTRIQTNSITAPPRSADGTGVPD